MTIPDAAIEAAAEAMEVGMWVAFDRRDHLELAMHVAIKAALPAIREAIAQEIEANVGGWPIPDHLTPNEHHQNGMNAAARIVRGGTP